MCWARARTFVKVLQADWCWPRHADGPKLILQECRRAGSIRHTGRVRHAGSIRHAGDQGGGGPS